MIEPKYTVLPDLCADLILGRDIQSRHKNVVFNYGGPEPPLSVCGFSTLNISPPEPFANLSADCHPIATKSRRYSRDDLDFIDKEVQRFLKQGIIEPSKSPWCAQVVVTKDENHRKRMVIDYSQTINKFTLLDAFPLPRINDLLNEMAQYHVFSTVDLRSTHHQVPLKDEDKPYTAFEASGCLYQFTRLPDLALLMVLTVFRGRWLSLFKKRILKELFLLLIILLSVEKITKITMRI